MFPTKGAPTHGKSDRHRPGHDQLVHGGDGGRRAHRHPQRRGRSHDPVGRRVRQGRPAPGRHTGQAPGGHQPQEHHLLDQALHGPQGLRGVRGAEDRPVRGRRRPERRRPRQGRRQDHPAAGDLGHDPAEAEGRRRGLPGRVGQRGRDHGPGVLQRRPAQRHQGRRQDRRPRGAAHHQRADRGVARLRARQGGRPDDPRLRPRRRHVRRVGARARRGRVRGQGHLGRQPPGRRQLRQGRRRLAGGRVQARAGHRPEQGPDGAAAALRGRREGQDRALDDAVDEHQPAVHHGRRRRPQAPRHHAHRGPS